MNQAITLLTNNWSNMPQLKLSPFYHSVDQNEVEVLTSVQKALIRMEQDSFKTFTDKKQTKLSSECIAFFNLLPSIAQLRLSIDQSLELNHYIQVIFEEVSNPVHEQFLCGNHMFLGPEYFLNTVTRIKFALTYNKCALRLVKRVTPIREQTNRQKKYFSQLLNKNQELACYQLELPLWTYPTLLSTEPVSSNEKNAIKALKAYLKNIHAAPVFHQKLCDIQWRVIKSIHGNIIGQILVYLVETEEDYQPYLKTLWVDMVKAELLNSSFYLEPSITSLNCYMGNGLALKEWKKKLDLLHTHLEFYSYKANGICFEWKSYTGNFYQLKLKE
ncbi:hypothetical protein IC789_02865 [Acinetobacter seifertii]|uniref:Uncharacterized protein n=1 Tax=Acinetobacter seifertii TaxID=1530123 RepID=A0A7H2TZ45_9GAMM|nr:MULTISPECIES: hypothetical protein [Acinetobacter]MBJ9953217.1 hypothetical protein [Acinetobacter baumannii]QNX11812.1 hypothetical protein IC794_17385 [Acinetobacter seifertii]QNX20315.1 hypothetical protein IC792_02875 [Acinetobacter seifertii]QNX26895.1 hypothetical protein IC791_02745 [Acinetobacter seifertii]QNX37935.1 hypothetical protein IC789_02865 [Acinetobacter seifertii]